ncbi:MAG: 4'-phosphopantetheinyl transferase superfamily protein [Cyclobacteriaceae bacterium]|nr:4'-phosphopantetheinyl transferase superfamily protein [Cyclobacteriaceae bacterium]
MPIIKIDQINKNAAVGLWKIDESESKLYTLMNQNPVLQLPAPDISNVIKKQEWMAGRLMLKSLVEHLGLSYYGIYKDIVGKPHLNNHSHHISLTHSFPWVGAIVCKNGAVGIDLEQPKEKLRRIAYKFLSNKEMDQAGDDVEKLCVYWCAKEALYKLKGKKGIIFKDNLFLEPFELDEKMELIGNIIEGDHITKYKMRAEKINKSYLVYSVN